MYSGPKDPDAGVFRIQLLWKDGGKMRRSILAICIAVVVIALVVAPAAARVTAPTNIKDAFLKGIWTALLDLQKQIDDLALKIKAIPKGDTGPPGPTGPAGSQGPAGAAVHFGQYDWDYQEFTKYTAPTDGFVIVTLDCGPLPVDDVHQTVKGWPSYGSDTDLGTHEVFAVTCDGYEGMNSFTMPVRAGDTWYVQSMYGTCSFPGWVSIAWIPLTV
jgi:hypothetical protein